MRLGRHLHRLAATLVVVAATVPGIALASYHAPITMRASEEVPPNGSTAIGIGTIDIINGPTDSARVNITFSGLTTAATAAHIHGPALPGVNAGVLIGLTVPPAASGTIAQSVVLTAANRGFMVNGRTYVNIHTAANTGGEIRGQVDSLDQTPPNSKVPGASSTTLALLGVAIAALASVVLIRRRATA